MRVALLTEGARPHPRRGAGDWCDRLAEGLSEHEFELYLLTGSEGGPGAVDRLPTVWRGVRDLALWGRCGRTAAAALGAAAGPAAAVALLAPGRSGPSAVLLGGGAVAVVLLAYAWVVLGRADSHR
ncbi:DUF3492 domain-containing protein [Kitasatospora sp. SUK 42]|uniref:DUF3492 domain-containing protein n=1 Tax=Kitasatospora sp. SUK 42 TaxID=1588882 RepID=UPI001C31A4E6|nr:DUF3492 domain-containing protein [Kitasatospora sp. SUK 42]MBV2152128.1 DUF3492 domain-containing protein [Kitasatospora sp. SUK 42]